MIRARVWLTCAAAHDPVSPILIKPALIGWEARQRDVELTIEREFSGAELLTRMKGWVTVDVDPVREILQARGRLKLLDEKVLVVEFETEEDHRAATQSLATACGDQVELEVLT